MSETPLILLTFATDSHFTCISYHVMKLLSNYCINWVYFECLNRNYRCPSGWLERSWAFSPLAVKVFLTRRWKHGAVGVTWRNTNETSDSHWKTRSCASNFNCGKITGMFIRPQVFFPRKGTRNWQFTQSHFIPSISFIV